MKGQEKEDSRAMSKEELLSGKTCFYFEPMQMIKQINSSSIFFRNTLHSNYLDFYHDIEDVVNQSKIFAEVD